MIQRNAWSIALAAGLIAGAATALPGNLAAQSSIEPLLQYQGVLTDADTGEPINGSPRILFRIYSEEEAETEEHLWAEQHFLTVENGLVSVILGSREAIKPDILRLPELWLGISLDGGELLPRQRILPTAQAIHAETAGDADRLEGREAADFLPSEGPATLSAFSPTPALWIEQEGAGLALYGEGNIRATNRMVARAYEYSEPREKVMRIPGASFMTHTADTIREVGIDGSVFIDSSASGFLENRLIAPLDLPVDGAVTSISAFVTDDSAADHLEISLMYADTIAVGAATFTPVTVDSSNMSGTDWISATLSSPHTIGSERSYFLRAEADDDWAAAGNDLRVRWVELTYEVEQVD